MMEGTLINIDSSPTGNAAVPGGNIIGGGKTMSNNPAGVHSVNMNQQQVREEELINISRQSTTFTKCVRID
jgi:hypothetical protein